MRNPAISPYAFQRGGCLNYKTTTFVEADQPLKPLRDTIIVEPIDALMSALVQVVHESRPLRGIVKAVGPGIYPRRYDHPDKHKRTKMWQSKVFRPTEVKVGDVVELGGAEQGGYNFDSFYWGGKLHIIAREEDVCGVRVPEEEADGSR